MNRRVALVWRAAGWSALALGAAATAAVVASREDDAPVAPGSRDVAGLTDELARALPPDVPRLRFEDHAGRLGLRPQFEGVRTHQLPEDMGGGLALADLDGDGDLDLLLVGTGALPAGGETRLHRNDSAGDGSPPTFTDVSADAGLPGRLVGMGAAAADLDGDGDLDLLLTHLRGLVLLRNDGDLRFTDVTDAAGLGGDLGWCAGAAFGDGDGDGDLDLYVCRYVDYRPAADRPEVTMYGTKVPYTLNPSSFRPLTNLWFTAVGPLRFEGGAAAAEALGIHDPRGRSLTAAFADLDLDGLPDLYVANDVSDNALFRGTTRASGGRGFEDVSYPSATADYRGAMGLAIADADQDGDPDMFVTHWLAQENGYYRNLLRDPMRDVPLLTFMDVADRVGLGAPALDFVGWATDFADLDLDGRPDLFAANGSTIEDPRDPTRLLPQRMLAFWNGGGTRGWFETAAVWGEALGRPRGLRGGAAGDLDGDLDLDLVLGALEGPPAVLVNEGSPRGRPLAVRLAGRAPNRFGVGASVRVECDGLAQVREVRSAPGYLSAGPLALTFGLGARTSPATVTVLWPDGHESTQTVPADVLAVEVRR